ncbi:hypothetical protein DFH08DRAFT_816144 [Mycena albidolilacea]|uniref:Uncharacterized protein n=1 Tax=Mycena albidolilacea TaxID=1033008 RepID=A0AAD6ZL87_9AGAR|nr:hypothetical protein DFH08DRAFT_816144 [Mycena albidolilacea]
MLSKVKYHLLMHADEDVVAFGPLVGLITELYESYNTVFRHCSILSNHLASSRDITRQLADQEGLKHRLTGGWWYSAGDEKQWQRVGSGVGKFLSDHPLLQKSLGWTDPSLHWRWIMLQSDTLHFLDAKTQHFKNLSSSLTASAGRVGTGGQIKMRSILYHYSEASHRLCCLLPTDVLLLRHVDKHPGFASTRAVSAHFLRLRTGPPSARTPSFAPFIWWFKFLYLTPWQQSGAPHGQPPKGPTGGTTPSFSIIGGYGINITTNKLNAFRATNTYSDSSLENLRIYGAAGYMSATTIPCTSFAHSDLNHAPLTFSYGFPFTGAGKHLRLLDVERIESITFPPRGSASGQEIERVDLSNFPITADKTRVGSSSDSPADLSLPSDDQFLDTPFVQPRKNTSHI